MAAGVAFLAIVAFMVATYGMFGAIASVALLLDLVLIIALLAALGATLTMPGIAGLVLTIGMAVDANVLIFECIREELKTARGPARAIELGFEKAFSSILDGNITTLIVAVILYAIGSGPVRGFGVTLALGIVCSVFTAVYLTRLMIVVWLEWRRPKTVTV
jgi:preprotein translocase subunit SecD